MKKKLKILLFCSVVFLLISSLCGCSTSLGSKTPDGKPAINIKNINWSVDEGIVDGKRRIIMKYTNNTNYPITEFQLEFKAKESISDEEKNLFYSDIINVYESNGIAISDDDLSKLKSMPISMWTNSKQLSNPGETISSDNCYYFTGYMYVLKKTHCDLCEPDIATIKFISDNQIYTVYYDYTTNTYTYNESTKVAYEWTDGRMKDILPIPDSSVISKNIDRDDYFSFDVQGFSKEKFNQYVEQCKSKGFTTDAYSYGTTYRAKNADEYKISLYYEEDDCCMNVTLESQAQ